MDITFLIGLIVVAGIVSALGSLAWWIWVIWFARKAIVGAQADMDRLIGNLTQQIRAASSHPQSNRAVYAPGIAAMMLQANTQLRQLQNLQRQQYEAKMGEIMGMAADAGIDWTPPRY